jgi:hypothetical protein
MNMTRVLLFASISSSPRDVEPTVEGAVYVASKRTETPPRLTLIGYQVPEDGSGVDFSGPGSPMVPSNSDDGRECPPGWE